MRAASEEICSLPVHFPTLVAVVVVAVLLLLSLSLSRSLVVIVRAELCVRRFSAVSATNALLFALPLSLVYVYVCALAHHDLFSRSELARQ